DPEPQPEAVEAPASEPEVPAAAQVEPAPTAAPEAAAPKATRAVAKSEDKPAPAKAAAPKAAPARETAARDVDEDREKARKAAEAEAAALRAMLNRPRKVLKAPEPEGGISGTLHKPAGKGKKDAKPATTDARKTAKA